MVTRGLVLESIGTKTKWNSRVCDANAKQKKDKAMEKINCINLTLSNRTHSEWACWVANLDAS